MYGRNTQAHVKSYRLATIGMRRDFLRYARGSQVTKKLLCATLTEWARHWQDLTEEAQRLMGVTIVKKETNQLTWKGFKDFRLTADQLEGFGMWDCHDEDLLDLVQGVIAQGYKLTFSYNGQSDTYNAAMTCNIEKHAHQGFTLSAFAPAFYPALRLLMYKHWILADGDWDNIPEPQKGAMG